MTEEPKMNSEMPGQENQQASQENAQNAAPGAAEGSWQEVGRQFQALGASIAQAVRTAWEDEQTQKQLQDMRSSLEAMVKDVSKAIEDKANTPQGKQIRQEAERTAGAIKNAGAQTFQEVRPHLIKTLQQLNDELQRLIKSMESKEPPKPPEPPTPPEAPQM